MSKQRNEPQDPAAQLADYDLDKTVGDGSTKDDMGDDTVDQWPSNIPEAPFIRSTGSGESKQHKVVRFLAINPDKSNKRIADVAGCGVDYVNYVRHKVSVFTPPDKVKFEIPKYPLSRNDLVKRAMKSDQSRFPEASIDEILAKYFDDDSASNESKSEKGSADEIYDYLKANPNADAAEVKRETETEADMGQLAGYVSSFRQRQSGSIQSDNEDELETSANGDGITIEIQLSRNEVRSVIQGEYGDVDIKGRVIDRVLDKAGL